MNTQGTDANMLDWMAWHAGKLRRGKAALETRVSTND